MENVFQCHLVQDFAMGVLMPFHGNPVPEGGNTLQCSTGSFLPALPTRGVQPLDTSICKGMMVTEGGRIEMEVEGVPMIDDRKRMSRGDEEIGIPSCWAEDTVSILDTIVEKKELGSKGSWQLAGCGKRKVVRMRQLNGTEGKPMP